MQRFMGALLLSFLVLYLPPALFAGTGYDLKCQNTKCRYQAHLGMGGGFIFEQISGYCDRCKRFVSLRWQRENPGRDVQPEPSSELPSSPPISIGLARSPITGEEGATYACPNCSNPFVEIKSIPDNGMLYCPKCQQKTLKAEATMFYD